MVRELSKILKIFLIGCKIKHYFGFLQTFFKKNCILPYILWKISIFYAFSLLNGKKKAAVMLQTAAWV